MPLEAMNPLLWLNPYRWLLMGAAVAALLLGAHMLDKSRQAIGERRVQARWDQSVAKQKDAALAEARDNAKETVRRIDRQTEAQHAHDQDLARARAAAAGADATAGRLRDDLAAFAASNRAARNPSPAGDSSPASTAVDLLAGLLDRMEREGRILAAGLDAARAAGLQCERSYLALTPPRQ